MSAPQGPEAPLGQRVAPEHQASTVDAAAIDADDIGRRCRDVQARAAAAAAACDRDPAEVTVLLATKTQPVAAIRAAVAAGARVIGENRVDEALAKAPGLAGVAVERHLIGPLQRNKVARLPGLVDCVQSVDRIELATRLAERWPQGERLDVFVQVNVSAEPTKSGCPPDAAVALAAQVAALPRLRLRGLMTIATPTDDAAVLRRDYGLLRDLRDAVLASGRPGTAEARELSMGMTHDFEIAIGCGATMVRVGTAVFGPRPPAAPSAGARP